MVIIIVVDSSISLLLSWLILVSAPVVVFVVVVVDKYLLYHLVIAYFDLVKYVFDNDCPANSFNGAHHSHDDWRRQALISQMRNKCQTSKYAENGFSSDY